jgi:energy-coupling factor transporter ATP-binding protein EcfA2
LAALHRRASSGLAPTLVEQTFETIQRIDCQRVTILLVEQDAPMALCIADYRYVLESGHIALSGRGRDLFWAMTGCRAPIRAKAPASGTLGRPFAQIRRGERGHSGTLPLM